MKKILFLALCLFSFSANAEMGGPPKKITPQDMPIPLSPEGLKEQQAKIFNTEVSRNLIHMAHAKWSDEIVKGHTTPEFFKKYTSGKFLQYAPYGQLMSFEGVYSVEEQNALGATTVRAVAAFELQKVDVLITYKPIKGRYLIDAITITPIQLNNQNIDGLVC